MKKQLTGLLFIFVFTAADAQSKIDVLHYKFSIELNDKNDTIAGTAAITFLVNSPGVTAIFDLADNKFNEKGMKVVSASFSSRNGLPPVIEHSKNKLILTPVQGFEKGDTEKVTINYKGIPDGGLIISKNKYGNRTFFADNWPDQAHQWIPCVEDPADKATVEFIITAPQHYQVVANGILTEETNLAGEKKLSYWKEDVPVSTKVMAVGVADFAVNLAGFVNDCIPVYSWVYPEDRDKGFYDYALAKDILPFYINNIGPYAYKKLANVQSKTSFGGLENANTIFYTEQSIDGKRSSESLMAHEIAHQWFGNMATEKSFAHLWLSEGFATYMTILYMQNKYGADTATKMLLDDRVKVIEYSKETDNAVINNTRSYMELLNPYSYEKGGWILHMLHRDLGDSLFWKAIRKYYATYAGKTADTEDLRAVFESVSGKNLKQFFQQWLYTPGLPILEMKWKYNSKLKTITITIQQKQSAEFRFPINIQLHYKSGKKADQNIMVDGRSKSIILKVSEKPSMIIADPYTSLLFEGTINEVK